MEYLKDFTAKYYPAAKWKDDKVISFLSPEAEYANIRFGAVVKDLSDKVMIRLVGNDVQDFIHRISTNSVNNIEVGNIKQTMFLNEKGRLLDNTIFVKNRNDFWLIGEADNNHKISRWLEKYIISEDIELSDLTDDYLIFEFFGKQAESVLTSFCGKAINFLEFNSILNIMVEKLNIYILKLEIKGVLRFWVIAEKETGLQFLDRLFEDNYLFDLIMMGEIAYDSFRVEKGIPKFPNEINDNFNPNELSLLEFIDFKKGCYIGQEIVARLDTYEKVQRKYLGIIFEKEISFDEEYDIVDENQNVVGVITSTSYSYHLERFIGIGLVKIKELNKNCDFFIITKSNEKIKLILKEFPII